MPEHKIRGTEFVRLAQGSYATVFVDRGKRRIRRILRVQPDRTRDHCVEVFQTELMAYNIVQSIAILRESTPAFFGISPASIIEDEHGRDVSQGYWVDLAIDLEFVPFDFAKVGSNISAELRDAFHDAGIRHLTDISMATEGDRAWIIDFATREIELWHE